MIEALYQFDRPSDVGVSLMPTFTGEAFTAAVRYPVIVERWETRFRGKFRKAYHEEFSEAERRRISWYHTQFHRWYLVTGTPDHVQMKLTTLHLLQRAVAFFASH